MRRLIPFLVAALVAVAPTPAAADEVPECDGHKATITIDDAVVYGAGKYYERLQIYGTPGDDMIVGTDGPDHISANQGGYDIICGLGGDDFIGVNSGRVFGGPGDDYLVVLERFEPGALYGGPGNDDVSGRNGEDHLLYGGPGQDSVTMGAVCDGGPGHPDYVRWCVAKPRYWDQHPDARPAAIERWGEERVLAAEEKDAEARVYSYPMQPSAL